MPDICDPYALSPGEAPSLILAVVRNRGPSDHRRIHVVERVHVHDRVASSSDLACRHGLGSPDATMFYAERAPARPCRNLHRLADPIELESDVCAVATSLDQHGELPG